MITKKELQGTINKLKKIARRINKSSYFNNRLKSDKKLRIFSKAISQSNLDPHEIVIFWEKYKNIDN